MADITEVDYIWKNGEMIPWAEATTHVLSHSLHYGSGVFEGIRCYQNPETKKSYVFRLRDHMERLHRSCKISLIDLPYSVDELCDATIELIRKNNLPSCYIRPIVYRGYGVMGVDPTGRPHRRGYRRVAVGHLPGRRCARQRRGRGRVVVAPAYEQLHSACG